MDDINQLKKRVVKTFIGLVLIIIFVITVLHLMEKYNISTKKYYKAKDFNINITYSEIDFDNDKIDDYSDFLLGSRKDNNNEVIVNAFNEAGYDIESMVGEQSYREYFDSVAEKITIDSNNVYKWQLGDIIIFDEDKIGIVSDKRNEKGKSYIIYKEDKILEIDIIDDIEINRHYRFNAKKIKLETLKRYQEKE